ncbi:MAG: RsmE family RNA methyltransferase [Eubacterium sp.]
MHRFFVKPDQIEDGNVIINGEDFKHITRVLRLKNGESIEVSDGRGTDYIVVIESVDKDFLIGKILESYRSRGEIEKSIVTLFQGLPKGSKMETIIQKTVETGVQNIVPFASERTVVQIKDKQDKKVLRWQRISYEAAKQSKRGIVPIVNEPMALNDIVNMLDDYDLVLVAYESEKDQSLKDVLSSLEFDPKTVAVIIGPEGGFAPEEIEMIEECGGYSVSLGKRILRTETAGVVLLAQLNFFYE